MASSENPQTSPSTNETATEATSVPLPPLPRTPTKDATTFLRRRGLLDALLVAVVLMFGFLVASFPATNTDFFRHAAIGRMILQGKYHFGVDPFVYTADDAYFVNHSWLFDLLLYGLYQLPAGGAVVVVFKALLTAVLAVILLCAARRAGHSLWIPAFFTALAVLALSPRLALQSTCLSFLFLGLTIWLLTADGKGQKRWWLLLPLFALWVNCDSWFFLGPLTLALYLAGELIQQKMHPSAAAATDARGGAVGWLVLAIGVAACLLNPHHVRALTLPPEFGLTPAGDLLEQDPQFYPLFLSPLGRKFYMPNFGLSVAGLAYWPLLLLGLASFVFVYNRPPWPRLLVWMGFALMSLYNWRAIPFFAVVAGPITALNWLDFALQRLGSEPRLTRAWRSWALGGRIVTLLLGLGLLLVTVPGWLQRSYPSFHRIGWSVQVDPSLQQMAETIRDWREGGHLPDEPHWFNMHYEVANYLAWFAPGERVFLDQSLPFFRKAAEDYLAIRKGLEQEIDPDAAVVKTDWQKILSAQHVRFWIYDNIHSTTADAVARVILFTHPQWVLCHLKGHIAIFAKRDPQQPASDPSTRLAMDFKRLALGLAAEPAPPRGVQPSQPRDWWYVLWDEWWHPDRPPSSDRESLPLYDYRYQFVEIPRQVNAHRRAWREALAASSVAGSLPPAPLPNSLLTLVWSYTYNDLLPPGATRFTRPLRKSEQPAMQASDNYVNNQFIESPSLYLAVRAARRALLADPEDGLTYFRLGQAYKRLRDLPQENQLRRLPPQVASLSDALRRTQMVAAFRNCLSFELDDEKTAEAHEELYSVFYRELRYIDAAVHHLRQLLDKRTGMKPPPGMSPTQYNEMLDRMNAELTRLDGELERRMNRYEVNAASKSGLEKAQAALQEGLSETALTVLEQEAEGNFGNLSELALARMLTRVALDLGRLDKAQDLLLDPEGQPVKPEELDLYLRLAAARGDYAEADRMLADSLSYAWQPQPGQMRMPEPLTQVAPLVGRVLLAEAQHLMGSPSMPWITNNMAADIFQRPWLAFNASEFWRRRWRLEAIINGLLVSRQEAEWNMIRGWLALEAGHCVQARKYFQNVRKLTIPAENWAPEVDRLNAWLDAQVEIRGLQNVGYRHNILYGRSTHYLNWLKE